LNHRKVNVTGQIGKSDVVRAGTFAFEKENSFVTIKDIADYVGVSTATVSLALSRNARITKETRDKVFEAVKMLNYRPSTAARNLALNRTKTISLILPEIKHLFLQPFFSLSLNGVYDACLENGYRLQIEVASYQFVKRKRYLRLFQERAIDGLLYVGSTLSDLYLNELNDTGFPVVLSGSYLKNSRIPYVIGDNRKGGEIATMHLFTLGRRKIAHIIGSFNIPSAVDRFEGYRKVLREKNLAYSSHFIGIGKFTAEGGFQAMKKILDYEPDAVFAGNDIMAEGAIQAIKDAGLKIPDDISVCGMDDLPLAKRITPALTTVKYDIYKIAYRAARKLIGKIEGKRNGRSSEFVSVKLIIRESCGAKRGK